MREETPYFVYC